MVEKPSKDYSNLDLGGASGLENVCKNESRLLLLVTLIRQWFNVAIKYDYDDSPLES